MSPFVFVGEHFRRVQWLLLALVLASSPLFSQAITANVVGTITDPSGAAVPGATVVIRNHQTNQSRSGNTDDQGKYEFPFLPVGVYTLNVDARGFQRSEVAAFPLSVDQVARVDVKLSVGQSSESVQVVATAILMQTENATIGTVIDSKKKADLPLKHQSTVIVRPTTGLIGTEPCGIGRPCRSASAGRSSTIAATPAGGPSSK